ncbi:MAG: hypothetical protein RLO08_09540 [Parvibaculaceae bacterium]
MWYLRNTFGPVRIFLLSLPAFSLVLFGAYQAVEKYHLAISGQEPSLRTELLSAEPDIFWTDTLYLNPRWDETAFPLLAKFKRDVSISLFLAPLTVVLFHFVFPHAKRTNFRLDRSWSTSALTKNLIGSSLLTTALGAAILLFTPSGPGFLSCRSALFSQCVGMQTIYLTGMIWATAYFVSALMSLPHRGKP